MSNNKITKKKKQNKVSFLNMAIAYHPGREIVGLTGHS